MVLYCIVLYCIVLYVPVIKWSPVEFGRVLFSKTNKTASAFSRFTFMHSDFEFLYCDLDEISLLAANQNEEIFVHCMIVFGFALFLIVLYCNVM